MEDTPGMARCITNRYAHNLSRDQGLWLLFGEYRARTMDADSFAAFYVAVPPIERIDGRIETLHPDAGLRPAIGVPPNASMQVCDL
jgi:hypothetical protein